MKVSVNPKAKKILDIYTSLPQAKKEALEKLVEAYVKETEDERTETDKASQAD